MDQSLRPAPWAAAKKIWLTSAILNPPLWIIADFLLLTVGAIETSSFNYNNPFELLLGWFVWWALSAVYSFPLALLLLLALKIQYRFTQSEAAFYGTVLLVTLLIVAAPFSLFLFLPGRPDWFSFWHFLIPNVLGLWAAVFWTYRWSIQANRKKQARKKVPQADADQ